MKLPSHSRLPWAMCCIRHRRRLWLRTGVLCFRRQRHRQLHPLRWLLNRQQPSLRWRQLLLASPSLPMTMMTPFEQSLRQVHEDSAGLGTGLKLSSAFSIGFTCIFLRHLVISEPARPATIRGCASLYRYKCSQPTKFTLPHYTAI